MFNKKSIYALNKRDPDAIVCPDANGNELRLTRENFASEAEFLQWKAWSDADYKETEKSARSYDDHTVALIDDMDTAGETLEDTLIALSERMAHDAACAAKVKAIKKVLTEKQFRRLWLYYVCHKNEQEIADMENVTQQSISLSIRDTKKKLKKIFGSEGKTPCKKH